MFNKNTIKALALAIIALFATVLNAFALSAVDTPKLEEVTSNSATISWNDIEWAYAYMVYYDTKEVTADSSSYMESDDLIEDTTYTISDLTSETEYFFYVTAINEEGNETDLSSALVLETSKNENLALLAVDVMYDNQILAKFNRKLDSSENAIREFKLENESGEKVSVKESFMYNEETIAIILNDSLASSNKYTLTVIAINDTDGKNIEAGVDGIKEFTTPATLVVVNESEDMSEAEITTEEPTAPTESTPVAEVEKEEASSVEETPEEEVTTMEETSNEEEVMEITEVEPEKLPTTGPAEMIVLIAALFMTYLIFSRRKA